MADFIVLSLARLLSQVYRNLRKKLALFNTAKRVDGYKPSVRRLNLRRALLPELRTHARTIKRYQEKLDYWRLQKRKEKSRIKRKHCEDNINAIKILIYNQRLKCEKIWKHLKAYDALPVDSSTKRPWQSIDAYIEHLSVAKKEALYA